MNVEKLGSHMQMMNQRAPWKLVIGAESLAFQVPQLH